MLYIFSFNFLVKMNSQKNKGFIIFFSWPPVFRHNHACAGTGTGPGMETNIHHRKRF